MRRRDWVSLFVLAVLVRVLTAAFIARPGYMDVAYYAAGAVRLAQGQGLTEPFLWHYLDNPAGIPHPAFLYWMPLPALMGSPFAALFPGSFFALQLPFIGLAAALPLLACRLAWETLQQRRLAWCAGLLVVFSGFFFPYWTLPETFAPAAVCGSGALCMVVRARNGPTGPAVAVGAGVLAGLAHLTRADGILWLPVIALAFWPRAASRLAWVAAGYLLVMGPWFGRSLALTGALLPPSGAKTIWLTVYDDLFCYGCDLSWRSYLAWGWPNILRSKLWALGLNLERFLAEDCLIFLFPFVLIGFYRLRHILLFRLAAVYLLLTYLVHSLVFTFPGPRGGFFHASAAGLPFLAVAGIEGIEVAVEWYGRRRRWNLRQARAVFSGAAVVLAFGLSGYKAAQFLPAWRQADAIYGEAARWMDLRPGEAVMVANPPAFWYHTRRPAVVVPNDEIETLLTVAGRYQVRYLLLDENCPEPLTGLYTGRRTHSRLEKVMEWERGVILFRVSNYSAYPGGRP